MGTIAERRIVRCLMSKPIFAVCRGGRGRPPNQPNLATEATETRQNARARGRLALAGWLAGWGWPEATCAPCASPSFL
eukprot:3689763-Alexandrium_andersonii.AAC.1